MPKQQPTEVQQYMADQINPFIEPLVFEMVQKRPDNPIRYAIEWLIKLEHRNGYRSDTTFNSDDEEEEDQDVVRELDHKIAHKKENVRFYKNRVGISEEVRKNFATRDSLNRSYTPVIITQEEKQIVRSLLQSSVLFQNLDGKDEGVIFDSISSQQAEEYDLVIKEGEAGDKFYIVVSGEYDCYQLVDGENVFLRTYKRGEAFGELALMYNSPRATSIVTSQPGKLLVLDRGVFSQILKVAACRKRDIIKSAVEKIELLKAIQPELRNEFVSIFKEERYTEDSYIIKQGQEGDKFYIVLQGSLTAQKYQEDGAKVVFSYQEGDYFGELALINNEPRRASVKASSVVKLASVSRMGFKRFFGDMVEVFQQQMDKYQ